MRYCRTFLRRYLQSRGSCHTTRRKTRKDIKTPWTFSFHGTIFICLSELGLFCNILSVSGLQRNLVNLTCLERVFDYVLSQTLKLLITCRFLCQLKLKFLLQLFRLEELQYFARDRERKRAILSNWKTSHVVHRNLGCPTPMSTQISRIGVDVKHTVEEIKSHRYKLHFNDYKFIQQKNVVP